MFLHEPTLLMRLFELVRTATLRCQFGKLLAVSRSLLRFPARGSTPRSPLPFGSSVYHRPSMHGKIAEVVGLEPTWGRIWPFPFPQAPYGRALAHSAPPLPRAGSPRNCWCKAGIEPAWRQYHLTSILVYWLNVFFLPRPRLAACTELSGFRFNACRKLAVATVT